MADGSLFEQRALEILASSPYMRAIAIPGRRIAAVQYYAYNTVVGSATSPLVANVPQSSTIEIQADSYFALAFMSSAVQLSANSLMQFNVNATLQIQDQSNGKFFFNIPTPLSMVTGAGGFPFVFPASRVLAPNTGLQVTVTNRDGTINPIGAFIDLHGIRIFYA